MKKFESGRWMKIDWEMALPESGDVSVLVSVEKIEHEWRRSTDKYIRTGCENGMLRKYEIFEKWIMSAKYVKMPEVCIVNDFVQFNNGRHRFAWLRDHGMTALRINVQPTDVATFETYFGSQERTSQWLKG